MACLVDTCGWIEWLTDAIIYATARQAGVPLVTSDDHFEGLPEVTYFTKNTGP